MDTKPRLVQCIKLKREAPGLETQPYPGELGEKIYRHVSEEAWNEWLSYLTILINEGARINMNQTHIDKYDVKEYLKNQMIQFLQLDTIE